MILPNGLNIKGKMNLLGYEAKVNVTMNPLRFEVYVDIDLDPINFGGGLFVLQRSSSDATRGPRLYMDAKFTPPFRSPTLQIVGLLSDTVFGVSREIHAVSTRNGFSVARQLKLFNWLETTLQMDVAFREGFVRLRGNISIHFPSVREWFDRIRDRVRDRRARRQARRRRRRERCAAHRREARS